MFNLLQLLKVHLDIFNMFFQNTENKEDLIKFAFGEQICVNGYT
jgi:hypothetical protein